jgi:septum formation protein
VPSKFEEDLNPKDYATFPEFVEATALGKCLEVADRLQNDSKSPDLIISGDTIVTLDGKIYGKPKRNDVAFQMLSELVGRSHVVYTGVVLKFNDQIVKFTESTTVTFGKATDEQIQSYVDTGEPLDKAGGYGIQGVGGCLIEKVDGDYFTVVGLPLYRLSIEICKLLKYDIK